MTQHSIDELRDGLQRLINSHFNMQPMAVTRIPAQRDDDDLMLSAAIEELAALREENVTLHREKFALQEQVKMGADIRIPLYATIQELRTELAALRIQVAKMQAVIDAAEKLAEVVMLHKPRITYGAMDVQLRALLAALDVYAPTGAPEQEGD